MALSGIAQQIGGAVRTAGMRLRLWDQKYREPDILLLRDRDSRLRQKKFWDGADLAIEIVSESLEDRERDLVTKRPEYARSGIEEYWIVDPEQETVTVLNLGEDVYTEGAVFVRGDTATSSQLPEFALPVSEILDADRSF